MSPFNVNFSSLYFFFSRNVLMDDTISLHKPTFLNEERQHADLLLFFVEKWNSYANEFFWYCSPGNYPKIVCIKTNYLASHITVNKCDLYFLTGNTIDRYWISPQLVGSEIIKIRYWRFIFKYLSFNETHHNNYSNPILQATPISWNVWL